MEPAEKVDTFRARVASLASGWLALIAGVLAVPAFLLTLPPVQEFFFNKSPRALVTISAEVPVYDGRRTVRGLQVLYKNDNLTAPPQRIVATRIRVSNEGGTSITPSMMTSGDPLGVKVIHGHFIEISGLRASTTHLRELSRPIIAQNGLITLSRDVILDPGDYIDLDILVISQTTSLPTYAATGKVAGQKAVELADRRNGAQRSGLFNSALSGSLLTQIIRVVFYFFVGFGLSFLLLLIVEYLESRRIKNSGNFVSQLSMVLNLDDQPSSKRRTEIALGIYRYTGHQVFDAMTDGLADFKRFEHPANVPESVSTTVGEVAADHGNVCKFLMKSKGRAKAVTYILRRFGLLDDNQVDHEFLETAFKIRNIAGNLDGRPRRGLQDIDLLQFDVDKQFEK